MSVFTKRVVLADGIRVEVAGSGEPLIYFHGVGTTSGFQDLLPLSRSRGLIVPIHSGFDASDDDAGVNSMLDYVVHTIGVANVSNPCRKGADLDTGPLYGPSLAEPLAAVSRAEGDGTGRLAGKIRDVCPHPLRCRCESTPGLGGIPVVVRRHDERRHEPDPARQHAV